MKKLSFLVVAGAMMAFASCGNNEATENATAGPDMSVSTENATDNATATEAPATEAAPAAKTEAKTK